MYKLTFLFLLIINGVKAQEKNDTIFGNPKFVKEYVIFINNSSPFIFMEGDNEYGHAILLIPNSLRKSMSSSWFETEFCRYINNETHYDENRNIIKETWYFKSNELLGEYSYTYDPQQRIKSITDSTKYSTTKRINYYRNNEKTPIYREFITNREHETTRSGAFNNTYPEFNISQYDTLKKVENVYKLTNEKNIFIDEFSYQSTRDTIFNRQLIKQQYYDENWKLIKSLHYSTDSKGNTKYNNSYTTYSYDSLDRLIKKSEFVDNKMKHYTEYKYDINDVLIERISFYSNRIMHVTKKRF